MGVGDVPEVPTAAMAARSCMRAQTAGTVPSGRRVSTGVRRARPWGSKLAIGTQQDASAIPDVVRISTDTGVPRVLPSKITPLCVIEVVVSALMVG